MNMSRKAEFIQTSRNVGYLKLPTNSGIIAVPMKDGSREIYIIDSGNTETSGKAILEAVKEMFPNGKIKAILNTHAHADHFGGNLYIMKESSCEVWASKGEATLMEYPEIETQLIWGGTPILEIRSKFLYGQPCPVTRTLKENEKIRLGEIEIETVSFPGHYVAPVGFLVTDSDGKKSLFLGDTLSGRNVLKTYWIQYLLDEKKSKESIIKASKIPADTYIPAHGNEVTEIEGLAELNLLAMLETEKMILNELKTEKSMEELLQKVAERNNLNMQASQYCLIGSTIRSYLSSLEEEGKVSVRIFNNKMLWKATGQV